MLKNLGTLAGAAAVVLNSAPALGHIDLLEPEARAHGTAARGDTEIDENSNLKSGPCGQITTGRTARVASYAPGETITVRVREENAHVSYLRVSIDLDGESFPLRSQAPPAPETQEEASAAEAALGGDGLLAVVRENNDTAGFVHELQVTLPNTTCDNCTLQVLQFMYDDPAAPYYFQCADLLLAEPAAADAGASAPSEPNAPSEPGSGGAGSGGAGVAAPVAEPPASSPPASAAGSAGSAASAVGAAPQMTAAPLTPAASASSADTGSGCSQTRGASGGTSLALAALPLAALALRSRRRSQSAARARSLS